MKYILAIVLILAGLGYAGQCDYEDAVIAEMKNNGWYYTISEEHPDWDESQMVKYYERNKCSMDEAAR